MNVKELIEFLKQFPEDMEVVYDEFESEMDSYNFIEDGYIKDDKLHLYED